MGHMLQFDPLAVAGIQDSMIAHDVPSPHGMDSDFAPGAGAYHAFAAIIRFGGKFYSVAARHGFGESQGGAAGAVFFEVMMGLDDFHVEILAQSPGHHLRDLEHQGYPYAHIGRQDDGYGGRGLFYDAFFAGAEAGGANHMGGPALPDHVERGERGLGGREVDDDHPGTEQGLKIARERRVDSVDADGLAQVGAMRRLDGADHAKPRTGWPRLLRVQLLRASLKHHLSHAPLGAQDHDIGGSGVAAGIRSARGAGRIVPVTWTHRK